MKQIVADANIWIHHWQNADPQLLELTDQGRIWTHPLIIGELSMGNLRLREATLWNLVRLGRPPLATDGETRQMVEARKLWGRGIGWNDAKILASVVIGNCELWTRDRRLNEIAGEAGVSWSG